MNHRKLLIEESPLSVLPSLVCLLGVNPAIVLQQIQYWLHINEVKGHNYKEGYYWTFNTPAGWQSQFPWLSSHTVRNILDDLRTKEVVLAKPLSDEKRDRTLWYTIDYDGLEQLRAKKSDKSPSDSQQSDAFSKFPSDSQQSSPSDSQQSDAFHREKSDVYKETEITTEITTETNSASSKVTPRVNKSDIARSPEPLEPSLNRQEPSNKKKKKFDPKKVELPNFLDSDLWTEWCQHRSEIKKPLTLQTTKKQLDLLSANQADASTILTRSIENGWVGLFVLSGRDASKDFPGAPANLSEADRRIMQTATEMYAAIGGDDVE